MGKKEQLLNVNTRTCVNCRIRNRKTKMYLIKLDPVNVKNTQSNNILLYKFDIV